MSTAEEQRRWRKKHGRNRHRPKTYLENRHSNLKKYYGIGLSEFDQMLILQGGGCAACGGPPTGKRNVFHVDHDHKTKKVRGLLCHGCNSALGSVGDNTERLSLLISYLNKARITP